MITKPEIDHILFATDLSENAERAFAYAAGMAEAYNARVTVLHVIERLPPNAEMLMTAFLGYRDVEEFKKKAETELITRLKQRIEAFCTAAAGEISECPLVLDRVIVEPGKAADRIGHHAATGDYDALVMGSRGHGLVKEALMGGTSRKVIQDSPIPVFVIPMAPKEPVQ